MRGLIITGERVEPEARRKTREVLDPLERALILERRC